MRSLLNFIIKHSYVFLFLLLETISLLLLFGFNDRQKSSLIASSSVISGSILDWCDEIVDYFGLKGENLRLAEENARLLTEVFVLRDSLGIEAATNTANETIVARVIDNSIRKDDNYITINKGESDGVLQGMGVYDSRGIVGIIMLAGNKYSVVLPLINGKSSVSCKLKGQNNFGFLEWKGGNPYVAQIVDLPFLTNVEIGDTIVTSGFSSVFPPDVMVGVVEGFEDHQTGYSLNVFVKLAVDFSDLNYVFINGRQTDSELLEFQRKLNEM